MRRQRSRMETRVCPYKTRLRGLQPGGFTLVEMLVVLAILAVLAGLLLPVLAQVRARARLTVCVSNQRQLGAAFALYAQDYDERLPDFHCDPFSTAYAADTPYWHDHFCCGLFLAPAQVSYVSLLNPYLHSAQVAFCPADTFRETGGRDVTSYEYKMWLARGRTLAEVPHPSNLALLWEQWGYHTGDGHLSEYDRRAAMNVLFVDSHVKWHRLADAATARYGMGPDLHGLFKETDPDNPLYGMDFVP